MENVPNQITISQLKYEIIRVLESIFQKISQVDGIFFAPESIAIEIEADVQFIRVEHSPFRILCDVKTRAEPRIVRSATTQLLKTVADRQLTSPMSFYGILAAPYISPESARICSEMGIGYVDAAGNCLLQFGELYVEVTGRTNKYKDTRGSKSIYERSAVKSSVVLRHLLHEPERQWNLKTLAETSTVSVSQASKIKRFLENREYIKIDSDGFHIVQPEAIIREWASTYNGKSSHILDCYSLLPPAKFEKRLAVMADEIGVDYCLTGFSAGSRYAPATRYNKVHFYVFRPDLEAAMEYMELKEVESGSNVGLMVPYDPCVLLHKQCIKGMHLVSPVQTCLDLWGMRPRGEEAAMAIIDKYYRRGTESDVTD